MSLGQALDEVSLARFLQVYVWSSQSDSHVIRRRGMRISAVNYNVTPASQISPLYNNRISDQSCTQWAHLNGHRRG